MRSDTTGGSCAGLECRWVYIAETFGGGALDDLIRPVKQWQAREEARDLSKVTIRGLRVGEWFEDPEVHKFLAPLVPLIPAVSMRNYYKGSQLRRAGLADRRTSLLQMLVPDSRAASVLALRLDRSLRSEEERVMRFIRTTGVSRATYFCVKAGFPRGRAAAANRDAPG